MLSTAEMKSDFPPESPQATAGLATAFAHFQSTRTMYDIIGDIHGHHDELLLLLKGLGYHQGPDGLPAHPLGRRPLFTGDFIDRGPQVRQSVALAMRLARRGGALALMGNHEFYLLWLWQRAGSVPGLWNLPPDLVEPVRATLASYLGHEPELREALAWFASLPLFVEVDGLRAVHACWDDQVIGRLRPYLRADGSLLPEYLRKALWPGNGLHQQVMVLLGGKTLRLPEGQAFVTANGRAVRTIRAKWWLDQPGLSYRQMAVTQGWEVSLAPVSEDLQALGFGYPPQAPPVFVGHYWQRGTPEPLAPNVACVDYSVAKGGALVAYRWTRQPIGPEGFFCVPAIPR